MSTELTDQLRAGMERVPAQVPPGLARTAYRRYRRRRAITRAIAAAATAAVAGTAAAIILSGPAAPAPQTTAYLVSRVTQTLDAMPAGTILFNRTTYTPPGTGPGYYPQASWSARFRSRSEIFTQAGQLVTDSQNTLTRTTGTTVQVNYQNKTWWRAVTPPPPGMNFGPVPPTKWTCASANPASITSNPADMAGQLRTELSCGELKAAGRGTVDGVAAVKLTGNADGAGWSMAWTYWVNAASFLPVRVMTEWNRRPPVMQDDLQWLPPTAANLAKLTVPIPAGFTQVHPPRLQITKKKS